jgi:quercetin dioxygenase-like cupin family protein
MKIFRATETPFRPADAASFTGPAQTKLLAFCEEGASVHLYHVIFDAGGRTNWHIHSGPQWLFIIDGRIRVQRWGEAAEEVKAGDAVIFSAGEKHWHGASPGSRGSHLAINVNVKTEWLEPVTDHEYGRSLSE